jgi:aspartyl-tRNA(Asn)/glutamyl-tRNA(Gln) amidotransferase subunit A
VQDTQLLDRTIREIGRALRSGQTSAVALVEAAIDRHARFGDRLQAYKLWREDAARAEARAADAVSANGGDLGPLQGVPVSIKDIFGVRGTPTFAGSPAKLPEKWEREGPVVGALRRQLCIIPGKTHTVEFAFGAVGTNAHWGAVRNPWDAANHRACGGSSAGAGVSLVEGSALVAIGSDTGGSVRIPASVTGTVGLKVGYGRWSLDGIVPLSASFDTPGPLARTVEDVVVAFGTIDPAIGDVEALYRRLAGCDPASVRLARSDDYFWLECSPGVVEAVDAALAELARAGARVARVEFPEAALANETNGRGAMLAVEGLAAMERNYPEKRATLDPDVGRRFETGQSVSAIQYFKSLLEIRELAASAAGRLREAGILVAPTCAITPPTLAEVAAPNDYVKCNLLMSRNTRAANLLGLCAITLPVGLDRAGMPVGLQLIANHGEEERLLAAALACERALGTARQRLGTAPLCRA